MIPTDCILFRCSVVFAASDYRWAAEYIMETKSVCMSN